MRSKDHQQIEGDDPGNPSAGKAQEGVDPQRPVDIQSGHQKTGQTEEQHHPELPAAFAEKAVK